MTSLDDFIRTLSQHCPPKELSLELKALWHDGAGDWHQAHEIAQDIPGRDGAKIHAYLHRKEGDQWNASYWYRQAGADMPSHSLDREWQLLVDQFLGG